MCRYSGHLPEYILVKNERRSLNNELLVKKRTIRNGL